MPRNSPVTASLSGRPGTFFRREAGLRQPAAPGNRLEEAGSCRGLLGRVAQEKAGGYWPTFASLTLGLPLDRGHWRSLGSAHPQSNSKNPWHRQLMDR